MLDFEVQRCTRHCATTDRSLEPGETFYSVLLVDGGEVVRRDYGEAAWEGPPEGALGWWKSQMPTASLHKPRLAPNEILLELFLRWQDEDDRADIRYVLTLLMIRRRVLRQEGLEKSDDGGDELLVFCPRSGETYRVPVAEPAGERVEAIQAELGELLFARGD
jgi:hypothetical protein